MTDKPDTSREAVDAAAAAASELWADLPSLMGRASLEGHVVGQLLASQVRHKANVANLLRALLDERDRLQAEVAARE